MGEPEPASILCVDVCVCERGMDAVKVERKRRESDMCTE